MKSPRDIQNKVDIETLVNAFYAKVKDDLLIGQFFTKVVHVDWEKHLPVMYEFWNNVLFHSGTYAGNPMVKHIDIHRMHKIEKKHFDRWLELFFLTTDELYTGQNAETIKQRAQSIATVMLLKILDLKE